MELTGGMEPTGGQAAKYLAPAEEANEKPMKRYDPNARCPKCGGRNIGSRYAEHLDRVRDTIKKTIKRVCARCLYEWEEAPLDATD